MQKPLFISIIINNYNYERFLSKAIDSALAQTYPHVEVIVVDDGSTDSSRDIIASYGEQILPLLQPNGKQGAAFNNGFAHSKGDVIIFLDADDYLHPQATQRIAEAWRPGIAKIHYQLSVVDSDDHPQGFSFPQGGVLEQGHLQEKILQTSAYCGVPTSGNALSRQAMEQVFPIPAEFTTTSDDYLSVLIPLYGEVVAIDEDLGAYRIHGNNQWALVELSSSRFRRFVAHDLQRCALLKEKGPALGYSVPDNLEVRRVGSVWSRMVSLRLEPEQHPVPDDRAWMLAILGIKALWFYSSESLLKRVAFSLWFIWVSLVPLPLAKPAINWLFMPNQRPNPLNFVMGKFRNLRKGSEAVSSSSEKPEQLRVLFVTHTYVVGVNQGKLAAIANRATVGLLSPSTWRSSGWGRLLKLETPYSEIAVFPGNIAFSGRGGAYLFNPFRIWQVIRQFKPDILQVEEEVFSLCTLQLAIFSRLFGIPLVTFGWENMDRSLSRPRRWVRDFVLKTAKVTLAGNREGGELLKQWNYQGIIEVMPQMGVDETFFTPDLIDHSREEINIGFLGRIVPEKGIDLMLKAAHQLKQQNLRFKVTICGSGPAQAELEQMANQLDVEQYIDWQGAVTHEQVPAEMAKFDVLVLPSRSVETWKEQFGHVLIESMVMGIPTVGSTCGEIPNVINNPNLVFEEDDADGLAAILSRLILDEDFRQSMGSYCLERAQQNYTHDQIAQRLMALWQTVLKSPPVPAIPVSASTTLEV
ncbi:glycosyl transferase [Leptolyngbya sp. Heron Island J]|uniref:glycosyltransferase n=1 Tax=Leptolyngbya sp. Heron Island J TaxID=1385935 RepID=UPI0003B9A645|nr:glycosyltransferase [Leptolyngbya sp. Heron Island J]ESA37701.1 glycosyl transferase [Leptolyngbya sp. Heron Island J]